MPSEPLAEALRPESGRVAIYVYRPGGHARAMFANVKANDECPKGA